VGLLTFDRLDMLVTSEPAAEIDGPLAQAAPRPRAARAVRLTHAASELLAWINVRLDDRCRVTKNPRSDA